jgi:hypothetical protein
MILIALCVAPRYGDEDDRIRELAVLVGTAALLRGAQGPNERAELVAQT